MRTVILTPWRPDDGPRDRIWAWCRARWETLGWPIYEGVHEGDPYSRAAARNDAARQAGGWDVALFVDADCALADLAQARQAVYKARHTRKMVYAHSHLWLTTEEGAGRLLAGAAELGPGITDGVGHPSTYSMAFAVPRTLWDAVGGYDERFVDWGWEDLAFMAACNAIGRGHDRVRGDAFHVWHPTPTWEELIGYNPNHSANQVLGERYLEAKSNPAAMRAILAER